MVPSIIDSYSPARLPSPQGGPPCFKAAQNFLNQACKRCRPVNDVMKKAVSTHRSLEAGGRTAHTQMRGEAAASVRRQREGRGKCGWEPVLWFLRKEWVRPG